MKFIKWLFWLLLIILLIWLIWRLLRQKQQHVVKQHFINWNIVLDSTLTHAQRDSLVSRILLDVDKVSDTHIPATDSFSLYLYGFIYPRLDSIANGRHYSLTKATAYYCTCKDSLLWNLQADLIIDGSGSSIPVTNKPKSTGAQGGIAFIGNNDTTYNPLTGGSVLNGNNKLNYPDGAFIEDSALIAVIDSGIDSVMLADPIRRVIVPFGENGSQNVMLKADVRNYNDNDDVRHGTSVGAIAMNEYYRLDKNKKLPRLLVLKALDDSGRGDIFSMSCAIRHAIDARATLINISAGYYGKPDDVLNYYLHLGSLNNIPVVVAAGNFEGARDSSICAVTRNPKGLLSDKLFYPACMSPDTIRYNIISVTGLKSPVDPCYYQNYSDNYVTVGLINSTADTVCCAFTLPFFKDRIGLEGSSFATPVITARLGHALVHGPKPVCYSDLLRNLQLTQANSFTTASRASRFFTNN